MTLNLFTNTPSNRKAVTNEWVIDECFCCKKVFQPIITPLEQRTIKTMTRETMPYNWTWLLEGERDYNRIIWEGKLTYAVCDNCNLSRE